MGTHNIAMVDLSTGEILPGLPVLKTPRIRCKGFFMGWEDGFERIAKEDMTGETLRVLIYCCSKLDYENYLKVTQKDVGEALRLRKTNVSRAFKTLVEKGILVQGPKSGLSNTYRLNEFYLWKGKVRNMESVTPTI